MAKTGPLRAGATRSMEGPFCQLCLVCMRLDSSSAMTFSRLECAGLESPVSWNTRSGFSIVGHKEGLTSYRQPLLCVCSYDSNIVQPEVLEFFKGQMTALVPDSLMCNLLLEGTRFPLQCVLLSENPTFLDASVTIEGHI